MSKELGKLTIKDIMNELNSLANMCDGRPMDERLANYLGYLMSELQKFENKKEDEITEQKKDREKCEHKNVFSYNHGYHNICQDCGEDL